VIRKGACIGHCSRRTETFLFVLKGLAPTGPGPGLTDANLRKCNYTQKTAEGQPWPGEALLANTPIPIPSFA